MTVSETGAAGGLPSWDSGTEPGVAPAAPAPPGGSRPGPRRATWAALAVLALVLLAGVVWKALQLSDLDGRESGRASALFAARQIAVDFSSFDAPRLSREFAQVARDGTPSFARYFSGLQSRISTFVSKGGSSRGVVLDAGVLQYGHGSATVLVALDDIFSGPGVNQTERDRMNIQLVRSHGRWLVDKVSPVF